MAKFILGPPRDDATSDRPFISWPMEHVLCPFRSQEYPKPEKTQEPLNKEKSEKKDVDEYFLEIRIRRCHTLKKGIKASEDMVSNLGKRIRKCCAKIATNLPYPCGGKRNCNKFPNGAPCPCARYVKVSRNHSLATTNDSTIDLHKQLKGTGHISKNWQQPSIRPTSVDVRKINHAERSASYQYVSFQNGNVDIETVTNAAVCRFGEGIDEIYSRPRERRGYSWFL